MNEEMIFARGLSDAFVENLKHGRYASLLQKVLSLGLDVQIREDYLDVYADGRCVISLEEKKRPPDSYQAKIHRKFVVGASLGEFHKGGEYNHYEASDTFVAAYLAQIEAILKNSSDYVKPEGKAEQDIIRASYMPKSPVIFFDRQIQAHDIRRKADLLGWGLSGDVQGKVLLTELKQGLDNRIQDLMDQMKEYLKLIAPKEKEGFMEENIFNSYQRVINQKLQLKILPSVLKFPPTPPPVECLFILYDYNEKSELLGRLKDMAKKSDLRSYLVKLPGGSYSLPEPKDWERL